MQRFLITTYATQKSVTCDDKQTNRLGWLLEPMMYVCVYAPANSASSYCSRHQSGLPQNFLVPIFCTAELSLNSHQFCTSHVLLANLFVLSTSNKCVALFNTSIQLIMQNCTVFNHQKKKKGFWDMESQIYFMISQNSGTSDSLSHITGRMM